MLRYTVNGTALQLGPSNTILSNRGDLLLYFIKYGVRSPKFIWAPRYSCTHGLRPRNTPPTPPPPSI
jgi:hypothetical protein